LRRSSNNRAKAVSRLAGIIQAARARAELQSRQAARRYDPAIGAPRTATLRRGCRRFLIDGTTGHADCSAVRSHFGV